VSRETGWSLSRADDCYPLDCVRHLSRGKPRGGKYRRRGQRRLQLNRTKSDYCNWSAVLVGSIEAAFFIMLSDFN